MYRGDVLDRVSERGPAQYGHRLAAHAGPPSIVHQPPAVIPREPEVDREKTCPLLLRVFPLVGGHHKLDAYARRGELPPGEVQMYTWVDATLRELTELVQQVRHEARTRHARLSFAFVYPDKTGRNVLRQVGLTHALEVGDDDEKTLRSQGFQTGDYLDVAIFPH